MSAIVADNVFASMSISGSDGNVELLADNGKDVLTFSGSNIKISGDAATDSITFDLNDSIEVRGGLTVGGNIVGSSADNYWVSQSDSSHISYNLGNVGINEPNPSVALQVGGDISASGDLYIMGKSLVGQLETEGIIGSLGFVTGGIAVTGDLKVDGDVSAKTFTVSSSFVSESIIYQSGSTKFGDTYDDRHDFTGSVGISGSLVVSTDIETSRNNIYSLDIAGDSGSENGYLTRIGHSDDGAVFFGGDANNRTIDAREWVGDGEKTLRIQDYSDSQTYFGGMVSASGDVYSGIKKLRTELAWKQDTQIVDYSFISSRTSSLGSIPFNNSENVYFNGSKN